MQLPRHLSYTRSLSPSKAVFFHKTADTDFEPLQIEQNKLVGQKSGASEAYYKQSMAKNLDPQDLAFGNPHTIDVCYVPPTVHELYCRFSLRIEANSAEPNVCDDPKVIYWLKRFFETYKKNHGFNELATRYAKNILMGNWLWRNRHSPNVDIEVITEQSAPIVVENVQNLKWLSNWKSSKTALCTLSKLIQEGLSNSQAYCYLDITATIKNAFCQEIHPSQKFVDNVEQGMSSKQLAYTLINNKKGASLNSQKVGAAIQSIDDWYEGGYKPLRVHEFGADKQKLIAYRTPKSQSDFYSLLPRIALYIKFMEKNGLGRDEGSHDIHFIAAVLIKGGLFQRAKG